MAVGLGLRASRRGPTAAATTASARRGRSAAGGTADTAAGTRGHWEYVNSYLIRYH